MSGDMLAWKQEHFDIEKMKSFSLNSKGYLTNCKTNWNKVVCTHWMHLSSWILIWGWKFKFQRKFLPPIILQCARYYGCYFCDFVLLLCGYLLVAVFQLWFVLCSSLVLTTKSKLSEKLKNGIKIQQDKWFWVIDQNMQTILF